MKQNKSTSVRQSGASKLLNCIDAHLEQMRDLLDKACGHGGPGTDPQTKLKKSKRTETHPRM